VLSSAIDETPYPGESAHDLVQRLAFAKADLIAARALAGDRHRADTEVTLESHIFGKPRSSDDARHMLEKLSGRTHAVVTGVALIRIRRRRAAHLRRVHAGALCHALPLKKSLAILSTGETT